MFLNENLRILIQFLLKLIPNQQQANTGSDNGLAPVRRQAIIWTNDGKDYWRIHASLGPNDLTVLGRVE